MSPPTPQRTEPNARRPWTRPEVTSTPSTTGPVFLCSTGKPYTCEGGGCCDASPDCDYLCNGG
jgi:hypothetical protein